MEPFKEDELSEQELDALLPEWKAPLAPAHLRASVFPSVSRRWWRNLWSLSIRVPVPVAAMVAIVVVLAAWRGTLTVAPRVIVRTERVEVPVFKDRVVSRTVYRDRIVQASPVPQGRNAHELQPVAELRPVIIRSGE
jgi:hypothetical protein